MTPEDEQWFKAAWSRLSPPHREAVRLCIDALLRANVAEDQLACMRRRLERIAVEVALGLPPKPTREDAA